ncbi:putative colanic acid biosynthesis acetyltransferase [Polymorphobacter arshaanensis]|uniref:Putative colanic acid biosynthesis acetyltransferase n=1 Tax=Glacieibacterium arshaanense TaxID=2511025 RepID=A0A4Y9EQD5_9SPHN|nr:putative colanic acid biosynthesis acetyltransferase [Polymorphobacter arshaanensis]
MSAGNKLARLLWAVVYVLLYRPSPRPLHGWRRLLLRLFGARIGAGVHPYPRARIWAPWNLVMEPGSGLADDVDCYSVALIHIGREATVSQYSYLCTASHDPDVPGLPLVAAPIRIGDRAWVGADVFVAPGVSIAEGAVVGARSTVLGNVGTGEIVGGTPARFIRRRADAGWR